jgi:hypothetical protein
MSGTTPVHLPAVGALVLLVAAPWLSGCQGGLEAGSNYPDYEFDVDDQLLTPENETSPSIDLGGFVIRDEICKGLNTRVEIRELAQDDLAKHLERINSPPVQIKARGNLYWYDFAGDDLGEGEMVRLRLAVLGDAKEAADELHKSILQHGPGWWGFRRSNLSVLAPKASIGEAIEFALRYKLPCWGMMEMANLDDVVVVPGPYMEF